MQKLPMCEERSKSPKNGEIAKPISGLVDRRICVGPMMDGTGRFG
jgi:hypothetical protein